MRYASSSLVLKSVFVLDDTAPKPPADVIAWPWPACQIIWFSLKSECECHPDQMKVWKSSPPLHPRRTESETIWMWKAPNIFLTVFFCLFFCFKRFCHFHCLYVISFSNQNKDKNVWPTMVDSKVTRQIIVTSLLSGLTSAKKKSGL